GRWAIRSRSWVPCSARLRPGWRGRRAADLSRASPRSMAESLTSTRLQAWWAVIVLMTLQTVSLIDRNILSLMIIEVRHDLGLSDFQVSLLTGLAFSGFYCIAGLVLGALVDRHSIRRVLYISVTIWSL